LSFEFGSRFAPFFSTDSRVALAFLSEGYLGTSAFFSFLFLAFDLSLLALVLSLKIDLELLVTASF
jgi:hypothetical protein